MDNDSYGVDQDINGLNADGTADAQTQESLSDNVSQGTNLRVSQSSIQEPSTTLPVSKSSVQEPSRGVKRYGEMADWWTVVSKVFTIGDVATVTDLNTGLSYQVVRKGGCKHADCQPRTAADTATMSKIYGGQWSWARRAFLISVDGRVFAASQNGMPHGDYAFGTTIFQDTSVYIFLIAEPMEQTI